MYFSVPKYFVTSFRNGTELSQKWRILTLEKMGLFCYRRDPVCYVFAPRGPDWRCHPLVRLYP